MWSGSVVCSERIQHCFTLISAGEGGGGEGDGGRRRGREMGGGEEGDEGDGGRGVGHYLAPMRAIKT